MSIFCGKIALLSRVSPDKQVESRKRHLPVNSEIEIFLCYAREDERYCKTLEDWLIVFQRKGLIKLWHEQKIGPGKEWASEIDAHLNTAQIILLLISPQFLASEYCYSVEVMNAIERHKRREARVIPIIVKTALWQDTPLRTLRALPKDAKAVVTWRDREAAFHDIAEGIRKAFEELASEFTRNSSKPAGREENLSATLPPNSSESTTARSLHHETAYRERENFSKVPYWISTQSALDRHLPVYLLINVSRSMKGTPIKSINQGLELFRSEASGDPFTREAVKVGVITFSNEARLVGNGLTRITKFIPPHLEVGGRESRLDLAFELALQSIDREVKKNIRNGLKGDWKPQIFVLTDSKPTDEDGNVTDRLWTSARAALFNRPRGKIKLSRIIAIGTGPNIDDTTLKNISTGVAFKMGADAVAFVTLFQYISQSISNSVLPDGNSDIRIP